MILNNNSLDIYSKYIKLYDEYDVMEEFKNVLDDGIMSIREHLGMIFDYEIDEFGSVYLDTFTNEKEPISFYVKIYDSQIFENVVKLSKMKNKKSRIITTESIKLLLALYLNKYFGNIENVKITRNCLNVITYSLYGFNCNVYIFASNSKDIMLETGTSKLIEADIDYFENKFLEKAKITNGNSVKICNILKNIAYNTNQLNSQFLIETLIYNVPDKYFVDDLKSQIIKVVNYIKYSRLINFKSLFMPNQNISTDLFISSSGYAIYKEFENFIKHLQFDD